MTGGPPCLPHICAEDPSCSPYMCTVNALSTELLPRSLHVLGAWFLSKQAGYLYDKSPIHPHILALFTVETLFCCQWEISHSRSNLSLYT